MTATIYKSHKEGNERNVKTRGKVSFETTYDKNIRQSQNSKQTEINK